MTLNIGGQMLNNLFQKYLEADGVSGGTEGNSDVTSTGTESSSKTFTQEDLNRIVVREKDRAVKSALKSLGFEDSDSAKAKLEEYRALEDDSKSLLEKVTRGKDKAEKTLAELKLKLEQLEREKSLIAYGVSPDKVEAVNALLPVYSTEGASIEESLEKIKKEFSNLFSDNTTIGTGSNNNPPRERNQSIEPFSGVGKRLAEEKLKQSGLLEKE